jgi:hypothetical protein
MAPLEPAIGGITSAADAASDAANNQADGTSVYLPKQAQQRRLGES